MGDVSNPRKPRETQTAAPEVGLSELRQTIDVLNARILALIQERADVVLEIASLKQAAGWCPYDPEREEEMLRRLTVAPSGPIGAAGLREIFTAIFRASLGLQDRTARSQLSRSRGSRS